MLTCFLTEKGIGCKIVKYSDRIWLEDDGSVEVMRLFIVELSQKGSSGLNKISFLIPRLINNIENLSRFSVDPTYPFNEEGRATGEISVIDDHRVIYDDFDCRVRHEHTIESHPYEGTTKVDINLRDDPIPHGSREMFRLKFNISGLIEKLPNVNVFKFTYFCPENCKKDAFPTLSHDHTILPVIPIYKIQNFQGGFDILVYAPPAQEIRSVLGKYIHVEIDFKSKGERLSRKRSGVLWHLREFIQSPHKDIVWRKATGFNKRWALEGTVEVPVVYEDIAKIKENNRRSLIIGIIGAIAGITALILYIISLIFPKVPPGSSP
ncbi:hypothetical protein ES702_02115 [subsurface metagenome]